MVSPPQQRSFTDTPVAASYERIGFGRINVRADEPLGERALARYRYLTSLYRDRVRDSSWIGVVDDVTAEGASPWYVTLFKLSELPEDYGWLDARLILLTFRRKDDEDEGPILAMDGDDRWFAICPPERMSLAEAREEAEALVRSSLAVWGQSPEFAGSFDLDFVSSVSRIVEWLRLHDIITELTIWLRLTNPGIDLSEDRRRIIEYNADEEERTLRATRRRSLEVDGTLLSQLAEDLSKGNVQLRLVGSGEGPDVEEVNTREMPDQEVLPGGPHFLNSIAARVLDALLRRLEAS